MHPIHMPCMISQLLILQMSIAQKENWRIIFQLTFNLRRRWKRRTGGILLSIRLSLLSSRDRCVCHSF